MTFDVNNEYALGSGDDVVRIINEITTYGTIIRLNAESGANY